MVIPLIALPFIDPLGTGRRKKRQAPLLSISMRATDAAFALLGIEAKMSCSTFPKRLPWLMEMAYNLKMADGSRFRLRQSSLSRSDIKIPISWRASRGIWEIGICRLKFETRFFAFGPTT